MIFIKLGTCKIDHIINEIDKWLKIYQINISKEHWIFFQLSSEFNFYNKQSSYIFFLYNVSVTKDINFIKLWDEIIQRDHIINKLFIFKIKSLKNAIKSIQLNSCYTILKKKIVDDKINV